MSRKLFQQPNIIVWMKVFSVEGFEKGLLYVDGVLTKILNAGVYYFWKNEKNIQVYKTDLRTQQLEMSGQEILTKDKANLRINFNTDYQVVDIIKALVENKDIVKQFYTLMQLTLREYIGRYTLDELLALKEEASTSVKAVAETKAAEMGIVIHNCGIRDIILPGDIKEIMNQVLVAEKKAQANVIMRRRRLLPQEV